MGHHRTTWDNMGQHGTMCGSVWANIRQRAATFDNVGHCGSKWDTMGQRGSPWVKCRTRHENLVGPRKD